LVLHHQRNGLVAKEEIDYFNKQQKYYVEAYEKSPSVLLRQYGEFTGKIEFPQKGSENKAM
jgi:hypothetical protein